MHTQFRKTLLSLGITSGLLAPVLYYFFGFSFVIVLLWLFGIVGGTLGFASSRVKFWDRFTLKDSYAVYFLLLIFVPAYFLYLYSVPTQMNTDELTIMIFQKIYQSTGDIFGVSKYFGFPSFIFIVTGFLAKIMGGVDILHTRIVHASMGLLIIISCYLFFRQFWKIMPSFAAALVLGASHSLLAISRMSMRDNSALLAEILAMPFLFFGLKNKNYSMIFLGGALAGLTYYVYQPARIFIFVWIGFLILLGLALRHKYHWKLLAKIAGVTLLGFYICALPIMTAEYKYPDPDAVKFSKERFLFLPEGQQLQKEWVLTDSVGKGIITNIKNGLGTFNNRVHDYSYVYPNYGHGFVDPLGGLFLWAGVLALLLKFRRSKLREEELFALFGFLSLWLAFAFLINKTPNYTRLLVILPFYVFFVIRGLIESGNFLMKIFLKLKIRAGHAVPIPFLLAGVFWIMVINAMIFMNFAKAGLKQGDSVGTTARYIEHRNNLLDYEFIIASDTEHMFYPWGTPVEWQQWIKVSTTDRQRVRVVKPDNLETSLPQDGQFTIFMSRAVWGKHMTYIKKNYSNIRVTNIATNGDTVAVEIWANDTTRVD